MPSRVQPPPAPKDIKTVEELYLAGLRLEQFHNPSREPYPYYEEAIRRDPGDYRSNVALGILACKRAMYAEAEKYLAAAVERASRNYTRPKDAEALYYLGIALRGQGKAAEADDAFHKAAWDLAFNGAANVALAESACLSGDFSKALVYVDRAIAVGAMNTKALGLKAAVLRKLGRPEETVTIAQRAREIDPLDAWATGEYGLYEPQPPATPPWPALWATISKLILNWLLTTAIAACTTTRLLSSRKPHGRRRMRPGSIRWSITTWVITG